MDVFHFETGRNRKSKSIKFVETVFFLQEKIGNIEAQLIGHVNLLKQVESLR